MLRRSTLLPIALLALATASAGPTTAPTTGPADLAKAGGQLRDELERRYVAAADAAEKTAPDGIAAYEQTNKAWADLVSPLTTKQCDSLIAYASAATFGDGHFDDRLRSFIVTRAVQDGDPAVLKRLFANVWVDEVDGCYTEWMLEKQTGRSVEILTDAYAATPSRDQADRLATVFRRAFSQVDGDHLTDREYVSKCHRFWSQHQPTGPLHVRHDPLRLNDHYQRPMAVMINATQARDDKPAAAPDPDAGMLFRE